MLCWWDAHRLKFGPAQCCNTVFLTSGFIGSNLAWYWFVLGSNILKDDNYHVASARRQPVLADFGQCWFKIKTAGHYCSNLELFSLVFQFCHTCMSWNMALLQWNVDKNLYFWGWWVMPLLHGSFHITSAWSLPAVTGLNVLGITADFAMTPLAGQARVFLNSLGKIQPWK